MVDPIGKARAGRTDHRHGAYEAVTDPLPGREGLGFPDGGRTSETAHGDRARRALDQAERAARLLERALVSMIGENELSMPVVGRLYTALLEAQASAAVLETELRRTDRRGRP